LTKLEISDKNYIRIGNIRFLTLPLQGKRGPAQPETVAAVDGGVGLFIQKEDRRWRKNRWLGVRKTTVDIHFHSASLQNW
jgi:hypothetical protein